MSPISSAIQMIEQEAEDLQKTQRDILARIMKPSEEEENHATDNPRITSISDQLEAGRFPLADQHPSTLPPLEPRVMKSQLEQQRKRLDDILNETQSLLQQPLIDKGRLRTMHEQITASFNEVDSTHKEVRQLAANTFEEDEIHEEFKNDCISIQNKIIAATTDLPPKRPTSSRRSKASNVTRGNVAALQQRLKDDKQQRMMEEELEQTQREFQQQQEDL